MKSNSLFDFSIDKEKRIVKVTKEFAAPLDLVWAAWTEAERLDQWWAPKPWKSRTKSMDFKEGGRRLYAMVGPKGEEHWCLADYLAITPKSNFKFVDAFCDKDGNINNKFPSTKWSNTFKESDGSTIVYVEGKFEKLADLEQLMKMGFQEGYTMALGNLEELLKS